MRLLLFAVGLVLVVAVVLDVLKTTMARGHGYVTSSLGRLVQRLLVDRNSEGEQGTQGWWLVQGGLLVMLGAVVLWIVGLWVGWSLVFCGDLDALVTPQTKRPATLFERVYFAGYCLFTLGLGDFQPQGWVFRLATTITSLSGLFVVTFSITYLVPVLQAAVERRQVAMHIHSLGRSAEDILVSTWNGTDCAGLESHLQSLTPSLQLQVQRHATYPVLHYFHGATREEALAPSVAALSEALTLLDAGLDEPCMHRSAYRPLSAAIDTLLGSMAEHYIDPSAEAPPPPDLGRLRRAGLPAGDDEAFAEALRPHARRRRLLLAFVRSEGWEWDDLRPQDDAAATPEPVA